MHPAADAAGAAACGRMLVLITVSSCRALLARVPNRGGSPQDRFWPCAMSRALTSPVLLLVLLSFCRCATGAEAALRSSTGCSEKRRLSTTDSSHDR